MSARILNRSFSAGEITPELFGRLDLTKVQEALALCMNFISLPHGPVVNRPGTEFVEEVKNSANPVRLIPFSYNNTQTFAIQLGAGYFRFHTQGGTLQCGTLPAWVPSATVTISLASTGVVTWSNHGLAANAPVSFATTGALPPGITPGVTYYVTNPATNTFQLATAPNGAALSTSASSTVTISITSPGVITWSNHGLTTGAAVTFSTTGALPTGITAGTTYYVVSPAINTFEIAAAPGGAAINTSGTQSGTQTCTGTQVGTHTGSYAYDLGSAVSSGGVNYYCQQPNANQPPPNAAYWYTMPPNGDYEIPNPYATADLMDIHYTQSADVLTLTHPNYPIMELRRYGATTWELVPVNFAPGIDAPVGTNSAGSPTSHQYVVTALVRATRRQGRAHVPYTYETMPSPVSAAVLCDLTQYGAYISLSWAPVTVASALNPASSAAGYNVYKLLGGVYQYIGSASGTSMNDTYALSAVANPGRTPPAIAYNANIAPGQPQATPYASIQGAIYAVPTGTGSTSYSYVVTALDAGGNESYPSSPASCTNDLTSGTNHNTINWPGVENATRYNVYKQSYGIYGFIGQIAPPTQNNAPPMSFVDNNITADISRTPPVRDTNQLSGPGDYPGAVGYYQQRRIFAGTLNQPQNVWTTRSGTEADLSYTIPTRDDNRIAFRIAGREASAIRHIVPLQDLLFLSASCEWRCSSTAGVLTPGTINVQPQSYIGANNVQPVVVGNAVLYAAARGGHIRQMNYNWQVAGYQSTDSSIFAPHLFDYNSIVDMAYCRGPIPILWCVSSSGKLLGMTYLPEQQIAAWHQHTTGANGVFESICVITEAPAGSTSGEDMLYCIVKRNINGVWHRFVERLHTRLYNSVADCHYVDCGATYNGANVKAGTSGTFMRSGTTMTCSITGHGLGSGQTCWLYFSDATFGALPAGQGYVVTVVDVNTFTITVPNSGATSGSVAYTTTGSYIRNDWTSIKCTVASHGLSNGQTCWLAFSDSSLGTAPGGLSYTVNGNPPYTVDANNFVVNVPTAAAISLANPGVITLANHGLAVGAQVAFFTTGALPAGMTAGTPYYVVNPTANTFQIAATSGGTAISTAPPSSPVTISVGAPAVVTWSNHGLAAGAAVSFSTTGTLPAGLSTAAYYVVNPTANTFQVAATPNGAAIATTSAGTGTQTCTGTQGGTQTCCQVNSAAVAISVGTPAVVTWNNHGLASGAPVMFSTTGALPTGITAGSTYYVVGPTASTFQIAAAPGGAAIATSGTQSGTQTCTGALGATSGTVTFLPNVFSGLTWLQGMTVNILADGAVIPPQVVSSTGTITLPTGATQVHVGLPLTAQLQTPPAAAQLDSAFVQGRAKNVNKVFLRTYRSSGILAGPDFADLTPYRQRSTENPGSAPNLVTDEVEIVLSTDWGMSGQICIQQSDPLPLDIASMTLEIAVGGGV